LRRGWRARTPRASFRSVLAVAEPALDLVELRHGPGIDAADGGQIIAHPLPQVREREETRERTPTTTPAGRDTARHVAKQLLEQLEAFADLGALLRVAQEDELELTRERRAPGLDRVVVHLGTLARARK